MCIFCQHLYKSVCVCKRLRIWGHDVSVKFKITFLNCHIKPVDKIVPQQLSRRQRDYWIIGTSQLAPIDTKLLMNSLTAKGIYFWRRHARFFFRVFAVHKRKRCSQNRIWSYFCSSLASWQSVKMSVDTCKISQVHAKKSSSRTREKITSILILTSQIYCTYLSQIISKLQRRKTRSWTLHFITFFYFIFKVSEEIFPSLKLSET